MARKPKAERRYALIPDDVEVVRPIDVVNWLNGHPDAGIAAAAEHYGVSASTVGKFLRDAGVRTATTRRWVAPTAELPESQ